MKVESVVFSDALQGGRMLLMVQRTWRSTLEVLARELTLLLVKFIQAGTGSAQVFRSMGRVQVFGSMPSTKMLLRFPSLTRTLRILLPRSKRNLLRWTGWLFRMVVNTSLPLHFLRWKSICPTHRWTWITFLVEYFSQYCSIFVLPRNSDRKSSSMSESQIAVGSNCLEDQGIIGGHRWQHCSIGSMEKKRS